MSGWNRPEYNPRRSFWWPSVTTEAPAVDRFDGSVPPMLWTALGCFLSVFIVFLCCQACCKTRKKAKECNDEGRDNSRGAGGPRTSSRQEGPSAAIQPVIIEIPASFNLTPSAPPAPSESIMVPSAPSAHNMPDDDPPPPYPGTPTKPHPPETRFSP